MEKEKIPKKIEKRRKSGGVKGHTKKIRKLEIREKKRCRKLLGTSFKLASSVEVKVFKNTKYEKKIYKRRKSGGVRDPNKNKEKGKF